MPDRSLEAWRRFGRERGEAWISKGVSPPYRITTVIFSEDGKVTLEGYTQRTMDRLGNLTPRTAQRLQPGDRLVVKVASTLLHNLAVGDVYEVRAAGPVWVTWGKPSETSEYGMDARYVAFHFDRVPKPSEASP